MNARAMESLKDQSSYKMSNQPCVLVVDDEYGPRQALRMVLKEDYELLMATCVTEAIDLLKDHAVDVIITDIRMPGGTGLDLLRQAKELDERIEVIILTGYGQLDTAMNAIDFGAFAYLEKPYDSNVLVDKLESCLAKQKREQERRAMEHLAMEANRFETLGRLVSGTMHDLGTPLSVIGTNLDIMLSTDELDKLPKRLQTMRDQVEHCNDLVRTTMNFLRHSQGEHALFCMNSVVNLCLDVAKPALRRGTIAVVADLDPQLPSTMGDMVFVRQAVLNLINNACQAMDKQEGPRQLRIQTGRLDSGNIYLSVQDSGPGIPVDQHERIFETLYTTKGTDGTGLGLSVVRNVMGQHSGTAYLEPMDGPGARFVLDFPVIKK